MTKSESAATVATDGEFSFCGSCPRQLNCCTRIRHQGPIVPPFLFGGEVTRIGERSGIQAEMVADIRHDHLGRSFQTLRSTNPGCIFHVDGLCQIYRDRPIDCRLFPFDVHETVDGRLFWVVYTKLCPVNFDYKPYLSGVKALLKEANISETEMRQYSHYGKRMYDEDIIELEEVDFSHLHTDHRSG